MQALAQADTQTKAEFESLNDKFQAFVTRLQRRWLRWNNPPTKGWALYEIDPQERARVDGIIAGWEKYVTPFAEAWWKRHGFGIRLPDKSSDPMQYYKLDLEA